MSAVDRLYLIDNGTVKKSVNIDDSLYEKLIRLTNEKYSASVSEIINVCIEDYIEKNSPHYYAKPALETVTYRSIMIREKNLKGLQDMNKETGITVTRLLNSAIKDCLEIL